MKTTSYRGVWEKPINEGRREKFKSILRDRDYQFNYIMRTICFKCNSGNEWIDRLTIFETTMVKAIKVDLGEMDVRDVTEQELSWLVDEQISGPTEHVLETNMHNNIWTSRGVVLDLR